METNLIIMLGLALALGGCREADQPLEIVKKEIFKKGNGYEVRGVIHNPRKRPARNVSVNFKAVEIDTMAKIAKRIPHGIATATIDYLPAGGSVDFTAVVGVSLADKYNLVKFDDAVILEGGTDTGN
jgi:hypothetical protein